MFMGGIFVEFFFGEEKEGAGRIESLGFWWWRFELDGSACRSVYRRELLECQTEFESGILKMI